MIKKEKNIKYGIILFISVLLTILLSLLFIPKRDPKQTNIKYNNNQYHKLQNTYNPLIPLVNYSNVRDVVYNQEKINIMTGSFVDAKYDYGIGSHLLGLIEYAINSGRGYTGVKIALNTPFKIALTNEINDEVIYLSPYKVKQIEYDPESGISNNDLVIFFENGQFDTIPVNDYQLGIFNLVLTDTITGQLLDEQYQKGYQKGKQEGYDKGLADGINKNPDNSGFKGLLFTIFDGLGGLLNIELLPNITIGAIILVPIVFGLVLFILGKKGD